MEEAIEPSSSKTCTCPGWPDWATFWATFGSPKKWWYFGLLFACNFFILSPKKSNFKTQFVTAKYFKVSKVFWWRCLHFQIELWCYYFGFWGLATILATFQKIGHVFKSFGHPALDAKLQHRPTLRTKHFCVVTDAVPYSVRLFFTV